MKNNDGRLEEIGFGGLKLFQSNDGFRFGIDAVLLADFAASISRTPEKIFDLGTGNGIIPIILCHKVSSCHVTGMDVQAKAIDLAQRSREINSLEKRLDFICCDISNLKDEYSNLRGTADCVVSNPPYVGRGTGIEGNCQSRMIARQETTADIEDFISAASFLLKERGDFFLVQRPSRLVDVFYFCRKYRLEPKHIRFIAPSEGKIPNIVLVHCVLGGGHELNYMDTLYVYGNDGKYTSEIMEIYEKAEFNK